MLLLCSSLSLPLWPTKHFNTTSILLSKINAPDHFICLLSLTPTHPTYILYWVISQRYSSIIYQSIAPTTAPTTANNHRLYHEHLSTLLRGQLSPPQAPTRQHPAYAMRRARLPPTDDLHAMRAAATTAGAANVFLAGLPLSTLDHCHLPPILRSPPTYHVMMPPSPTGLVHRPRPRRQRSSRAATRRCSSPARLRRWWRGQGPRGGGARRPASPMTSSSSSSLASPPDQSVASSVCPRHGKTSSPRTIGSSPRGIDGHLNTMGQSRHGTKKHGPGTTRSG